jgi:uncharacterized RDD family membrane protein YckC
MELYQEDRELIRQRPALWRGYALSGWWRRVGATVLDGLVVIPIGVLIGVALGLDLDRLYADEVWLATASAVLTSLAYFPTIMRATDGRTLGKTATGIRVVRTDGEPMSFTRATWRELILKMSFASAPVRPIDLS